MKVPKDKTPETAPSTDFEKKPGLLEKAGEVLGIDVSQFSAGFRRDVGATEASAKRHQGAEGSGTARRSPTAVWTDHPIILL